MRVPTSVRLVASTVALCGLTLGLVACASGEDTEPPTETAEQTSAETAAEEQTEETAQDDAAPAGEGIAVDVGEVIEDSDM
ncbi:MAG: hypothetical protein ACTH31_12045, partial [Pseudoclavibacter sp.]